MSNNIMDRLYAIKVAAESSAANQAESGASQTSIPSSALAAPTEAKPVEWNRADTIAALEQGDTSKALLLSLQAIAQITGDQELGDLAQQLVRPSDAGEIWKRACEMYLRFKDKAEECGRRRDRAAATDLFEGASYALTDLFVCPGIGCDPIGDELGAAVYSALGRVYEEAERDAEREAYAADKGILFLNDVV